MSVQRFNKKNSDTQPYHIYYDMNLINNDSSFPAPPVRFQYKETRSNYFLLSPQDYYMSIVRFNLQTPTLPVFIPQVDINASTNTGSKYPFQSVGTLSTSMTGAIEFNLYCPADYSAGQVIYISKSNPLMANTNIYEYSGLWGNYFKITNVATNSFGITTLTGINSGAIGHSTSGNPNQNLPNYYSGNVAGVGSVPAVGAGQGSLTIEGANISITTCVFNPATTELTITITPINDGNVTLQDLTLLFTVSDPLFPASGSIFINSAIQYNGQYSIKSVTATSIVLNASQLLRFFTFQQGIGWVNTGGLKDYQGSGYFTSPNDFYNKTPYVITHRFTTAGTFTYSQAINYIPNDLTQNPPTWNPANEQALSIEDLTSPYYWVYNYEAFINMVNNAFINSFWGLSGAYHTNAGLSLPASGLIGSGRYNPPSMSWNTEQLTGIITADNVTFSQNRNQQPVYLYFNSPFSTLFDSFPYQYPDVPVDSPLYSYCVFSTLAGAGLYVVSSYSNLGVITPLYTAIQIYQEHQTASLMNPIQSIVFTSTLLPVVNENVGLPLIINGTSPNQIQVGSSANIFPVVTDFIVPFSATNGYVPDVSYVPSGEYRLVDLYGESPANQIDIQVFWKDQYGLLHPFLVGSGCTGSLKVMFRRKNFNNVFEEEI